MGAEHALEYVRELEREDEGLARTLEQLSALSAEVEELGASAAAIAELLEHLPGAREAAERAVAEAEAELAERRDAAAGAEAALQEAAEREASRDVLAEARRELTKARDELFTAEKRAERARADLGALESDAREAQEEAPKLEERAHSLAERIAAFPQLARRDLGGSRGGLGALVGWAARARAALFVARNNLETQREGVVRQANEVLATVTGEPVTAASVLRARERLESLP